LVHSKIYSKIDKYPRLSATNLIKVSFRLSNVGAKEIRMKLLFITSLVPHGHPSTGYEIANEAIIDGLTRIGADVTVLGFTWPGKHASNPEKTIVLGEVDVRTEGADPWQKMRWVAAAVAGGYTISSVKMRIINEQAIRAAIDAHGPFDAYVLNGVSLPGAFPHIFNDLPSLWIAHNVEYKSSLENAQSADSALKRTLFKRDARILEVLEKNLAQQAKFVYTLAEEDRAPLGVASAARSAVLPLTTTNNPSNGKKTRTIKYDAGLIGTWTWQPNRVGLEWFIQDIAPSLPANFKVAVAGSMPAGLPKAPANIEFLGRVPDAKEFVNSCAVIPLIARGGTGVQLKTIETFEMGLPSVATSLSLRGIATAPANCFICDVASVFAAKLTEVAAMVRAGTLKDESGLAFSNAQRDGMDEALRYGLKALQGSPSAQQLDAA
jgi:Glycosyl transferases group 1